MFPPGLSQIGASRFGIPTGTRTKNAELSATKNIQMQATNDCGQPFARNCSQRASPVLSASLDTASLDSPSFTDGRTQNAESLGDDVESPNLISGKKKKREPRSGSGSEKGGRGLRQFSMKVCEKVESKGRTTYNEVADELVAEFTNVQNLLAAQDQQQYDEKNIRRRVYDALNVLMAMDIISKEKKEVLWKGLPSTNVGDIESLKAEHIRLQGRIEKKTAYLKDLEDQIVGIRNLIGRNVNLFQGSGTMPANGVALPFILVQTQPHATVELEISEDMQLVHFDFNDTPFELHDDAYVLKAMRPSNMKDQRVDGVLKPEVMINEDLASLRSSPVHHASHFRVSSLPHFKGLARKAPNAHLLPGILKARLKQEGSQEGR